MRACVRACLMYEAAWKVEQVARLCECARGGVRVQLLLSLPACVSARGGGSGISLCPLCIDHVLVTSWSRDRSVTGYQPLRSLRRALSGKRARLCARLSARERARAQAPCTTL